MEEATYQPAYRVNEACRHAKVSRSKLYEDIAAGRLKAKKNGRSTIILGEELRRYLHNLPDASADEARAA